MNDIHLLLLGFALGTVPSVRLARLFVAALAKRMGVRPKEVEQYADATTNDDG
jgi:hypothetical protein